MALSAVMLTAAPLHATEADDRIQAAVQSTYVFRIFLNEESITTEADG